MSPSPEPLIIVGAGGFGRETVDVVRAQNAESSVRRYELIGVVDSSPSHSNLERLRLLGVEYLGTEDEWLGTTQASAYLVGVGNPIARKRISSRFDAAGHRPGSAIHPQTAFGSLSSVSPGMVVCAGVRVSTNVKFGHHVHLNPNATIGHDSTLEDFVSINPGAVISGDVLVGEGVLVGAGAVVLQGLEVGSYSTVGAAACVTRDVQPSVIVKGIPAR